MLKRHVQSNDHLPLVTLDDSGKCIRLSGKSIMENPKEWYEKLSGEIQAGLSTGKIERLAFQFEYFNTASAKQIYRLIQNCRETSGNINIVWFYDKDDEDMLETGEDYQDMCGFSFEFRATG